MKLKQILIVGLIFLSLLLFHILYKWLQEKLHPRRSLQRFLIFTAVIFVVVFIYTFLLVFGIRVLFPGA